MSNLATKTACCTATPRGGLTTGWLKCLARSAWNTPSTVLLADYIGLKPDVDWVEARGEVQLDHEGSTLTSPSLRYQMNSKQARYTEGARITDDGWTVTSQTAALTKCLGL